MKVNIKIHNGTPTLFLNDLPSFFGCHLLGSIPPEGLAVTQDCMREFANAGVHIYSIDAVVNEWIGPRPGNPSPFDFSQTARRLQNVVDADPQALLLLRMGFETRYLQDNWWNLAYPDEVEVLSNGDRFSASFASMVWRTQVKDLLRAYIAHLRETGLYDRVIAYQIATGTCGEWIKDWSSMDIHCGDYSPAMRTYFQNWLRTRYQNDVSILREKWNNPQISFETAEAPTQTEQFTTAHFLFRDPRREQKVIDFYDCYADASAEALIDFCHTVKEETSGEKLAGAFFGYLMEISWNDSFFVDNHGGLETSEVSTTQRSGHLGLRKVLRSPDVDFLVSPYGYAFRGLGGDCLPMQPTEALRLHGKLYLLEEDSLMHNNFDPDGRMHPFENSIAIYQRNFAQAITHGLGVTWLETSLFQESPGIIEEAHRWLRRYQELGNWALQLDLSRQAEVAVFLDDESFFYETIHNHIDLPLIWQQRVVSLNRFGAPHDVYLMNDLLENDLPPYKLYLFLNPFHLGQERRKRLKSILRRDHRTALWFYAPGYINTDDTDSPMRIEYMTDLTGMQFQRCENYYGPFMHIINFEHPITQGLPQDLFWGSTRNLGPTFYLNDPQVINLGQVVLSSGRCKPGFGVKSFELESSIWNSIYCATPNIPPAVLRGVARFAGVHLYNEDGDVLYANHHLLSVHTVSGGRRRFQLPRQVEVVYDLFNDQIIAQNTSCFEIHLQPASTALYFTGETALIRDLRSLKRRQP
jgi:hypothetical protein